MFIKFKQLACRIGRHDLFIVRAISDQSAQVECNVCGKQWALKMSGDCQGNMIPWETAKFFYTEERIKSVTQERG